MEKDIFSLPEDQLKKLFSELQQTRLENDYKEYQRQNVLFENFDLDFNTFRILQHLAIIGEDTEPSKIADELYLLRSTVANVLNRMEKNNLITRTLNPNDRRRISVKLTENGNSIAQRTIRISQDYHRRSMSCFTVDELQLYVSLRKKVAEARDKAIKEISEERKNGLYEL